MKSYSYDPITGESNGVKNNQIDPVGSKEAGEAVYFPLPATTELAPPECGVEEAAVFDGEEWALVPDFRGQTAYDQNTGDGFLVEALGPLVDGFDFERPILPVTEAQMVGGIQKHLDTVAQSRGYDNILSLASYAGDSDPVFLAEGNAGKVWRGLVWAHAREQLALILGGSRTLPETVEDFVAELPAIDW